MSPFRVIVCGGGIAAVEALLRLRRLGGDRLDVTWVCPEDEFYVRPLAVLEPFVSDPVRRYPIARVAADTSAAWVQDRVAQVRTDERSLVLEGGDKLFYDALLLAIGGREKAPFEHALVFSDHDASGRFRSVVSGIEDGALRRLAFVLPDGPVWPVPLYELALLTASAAARRGIALRIDVVTPEARPLKAFGEGGGEAMTRLLADTGITLHAAAAARVPSPDVVLVGSEQLDVDLVVTLPRVTGPALAGIPAGAAWFIPIDEWCRVPDADGRVFAAGDATDYPVKHGGLAAQQADTAAAGIAWAAGLGPRPEPFAPVIRGMLLTGDGPLYLSARIAAGLGWHSQVYEQPPWPAGEKLIAEELGQYLAALDG